MVNKTTYQLELEGFQLIDYTDMLEMIIAGDEIVLTTNGDKLYWQPRWPCTHANDTNVQAVS